MDPALLTRVRRAWLERVLDTVRRLGASRDLAEALEQIAQAVTEVLEFESVAINMVVPGDEVLCVAVAGVAAEHDGLLGVPAPLERWEDLVAMSEAFGPVLFYGHDQDQSIFDDIASVVVDRPVVAGPDAWHPDDILFVPLHGADGALLGMLGVDLPRSGRFPDEEQRTVLELFAVQAAAVIEESNRRARLGDQEQLYRTLFTDTPAPTLIVDTGLVVVAANQAAADLLARSVDDLVGASLDGSVEPIDRPTVRHLAERVLADATDDASIEHRIRRGDGGVAWVRTGIGRIGGAIAGTRLVLNLEEVTEARRTIDELRYLSDHDALTGLANRMATYDRLAEALEGLADGEQVAVLACGVDGLGAVNRVHGHVVGDEVLVRVARRLEGALRPGDRLCRPGDDVFDVLAVVEGVEAQAVATALAERCIQAIRPAFELRGGVHEVSLCVGVVLAAGVDVEPASVLGAAAGALLAAEERGRGRWHVGQVQDDEGGGFEGLDGLDEGIGPGAAGRVTGPS